MELIKPSYKVRINDDDIVLTIGDPDRDHISISLTPEQAFEMARQINLVATFSVVQVDVVEPSDD